MPFKTTKTGEEKLAIVLEDSKLKPLSVRFAANTDCLKPSTTNGEINSLRGAKRD